MTVRVGDCNGGSLGVKPDDDADALAQMLVGEADGVADEELFALRSRRWRRWRRFDAGWATRRVRNDRRVQHGPTAPSRVVLDHCLGLPKLDDGAL